MKRIMLLMSLISVLAFEGGAKTLHWAGVGDSGIGDFEVPSNWQENGVPGVADLAAINNNVDKFFKVIFNSDVTNAIVSITSPSPGYDTLFVMNQHVWTATNNLLVWDASGGRLTFTNGTLRTLSSSFAPGSGVPVPNLMLSMKDVVYETTDATFSAGTASFDGGCLQVSNFLSVGVSGRPAATLKLAQGVQCNVTNIVYIGQYTGSTGEFINVNGAFCLTGSSGSLQVGRAGCGVMTLNGGSTYISNVTIVGTASTSVGHLTVTGGSNTFGNVSLNGTLTVADAGKGSLLITGGTNSVGGTGSIGSQAGSVGEVTLTNGLLTIGRFLHVGYNGSGFLNIKGGEMRFVNANDPIMVAARFIGSTGTVAVTGGLLDVNGPLWLGGAKDALGRLTLSGNGVLRVKTILEKDAVATSQILFDGGILQAAASGTLIQPLDDVQLTANGMVVDTAGYTVSVVPTLQNAEGEAGGISKKGMGTLTLAGTRAATGPVSVLDGTLVVSNTVTVSAGTSRIDGTLSLTSDHRLIVEADAALAGTGTVARVTLADNAVLARCKTDHAVEPLNVSDCMANGHLTVALSDYALTDLLSSLPLLKVPTAGFAKPTSVSVTRDNADATSVIVRYTESGTTTVLNVVYNSGTLIRIN